VKSKRKRKKVVFFLFLAYLSGLLSALGVHLGWQQFPMLRRGGGGALGTSSDWRCVGGWRAETGAERLRKYFQTALPNNNF
jgi:hypothetical protein